MITFFFALIGISMCFNTQTTQTEYFLVENNELIMSFSGLDTMEEFNLQETEENRFCAISDK